MPAVPLARAGVVPVVDGAPSFAHVIARWFDVSRIGIVTLHDGRGLRAAREDM